MEDATPGFFSGDDLRIRPASEADLPRIRDVIVDSFDGVTGHQLLEQRFGQIGGWPWQEWKAAEIETSFRQSPESVLVAELGAEIVGVVSFRLDRRRLIGHIGNNGVDPRFQGRGIGTRMYQHVLEIFREAGMRFAEVTTGADDEASRARRAYEKVGFHPLTTSVRYFREL
jgi:ribosomal protein S18 acetylase RimI-like enzyme